MKVFTQVSCTLIAASALLCMENKVCAVGASVPWTEYEAEAGTLGGGATVVSVIRPLSANAEPVLEASGGGYVSLAGTGQSVSWVNNSGQSITALNVRIQIPDAPGGGGITATLDLYVNGTFRQAINVNSMQTYVYAGNNRDKNPADGNPTRVWDEYRFFVTGAAIAPGSTIMLKKDSANTASFYNVDLIDLETPPPPLTQPANSLSILSYGAVSNNPSVDNTTAIQNCMNAAQSQGKSVWIPAGTFYMGQSTVSGVFATGITVGGAGMWYTTLYSNPSNPVSGGEVEGGTSYTIKNLAIDGNAISAGCASAIGISGTNWCIDSVWVEHMSLAVWGAGRTGLVQNVRVTGTWSDGINLNNFAGTDTHGEDLTETNNFVRGTGDDAMALNGTEAGGHTAMNRITQINNTIVQTAGRIVVYGANNVVIKNNFCHDVLGNDGIQVGYHQQTASITNVLVTGNVILRCGSDQFGGIPGMVIGTSQTNYNDNGTMRNYVDSGITVIGNTISQPYFGGVDVQMCSGVDFEDNVISSPGSYGMKIDGNAIGNATIQNNVLAGLAAGQSAFISGPNTFNVETLTSPFNIATEAASYNSLSGSLYLENCSEGGQDLCSIQNGNYAVYNNINLNGVNSFAARVASANAGGNIQVRLDSANGTLIGTCAVPSTGGWQTWTTQTINVSGATGYHNVYLVFTGGAGSLFNVEWFALLGGGNKTEAASYNSLSPGAMYLETCSEGGQDLANIDNGNYAVYNGIDLNGVSGFSARVASASTGGNIEVHLDSATGTLVGTCAVPVTGGWQTWTTQTIRLTGASGFHNVYLVFTGGGGALFNLEWFSFLGPISGTDAASYNSLSPGSIMYLETCSEGGQDLCTIQNGNYAVFNNINLNGITAFSARTASATAGGNIQVRLDSTNGTLIGTCPVPSTGGWQTWTTQTINVSGATGYHNVYLVFTGGSGSLFNLEWFAFLEDGNKTEAASYNSANSVQTETCAEGGLDLGNIYNGSYTVYNQINLNGMTSFDARVASAGAGGSIQIRLDSSTGTLVGTCPVPVTGGWQTWTTVSCALNTNATGYHNVYLIYTGGSGFLFNVQWFAFQGTVPPVFPAANYSAISGGCQAETTDSEPGTGYAVIGSIQNGCYTGYNSINLNGFTNFQARVASAGVGGNIIVHLDSPTGTVIGTATVPLTGGWQTYTTVNCNLSGASGTHNIYTVFTGPSGWLFNFEWFRFQ